MGTFCLLLQFLHHKLNAVCLAKNMNKLRPLKLKMQVTGNYRSDSNNDRHKKRTLVDCCFQAFKQGVELRDMLYSLCKHHLLKTIWVLQFALRAAQSQQNTNENKHVFHMHSHARRHSFSITAKTTGMRNHT